jgi:alpha-tubulin suppressor-like RCC1 family protein
MTERKKLSFFTQGLFSLALFISILSTREPVNANSLAPQSTGYTALAAGGAHTCGLTSSGAVKCWGENSDGQLGDGTKNMSLLPVDVLGLTGVVKIAAGSGHTCALTGSGSAYCWGDNWRGQLGNGTTNSSSVPVLVSGLDFGVTAIDAGTYDTCAIQYNRMKCWGQNPSGQLGTGDITWTTTPVDVTVLNQDVSEIAVGYNHACASISATGGIKCWGDQLYGQLGNNVMSFSASLSAVDVIGLTSGSASLQSNDNTTCAILNGAAKCWGKNTNGQLGNGSTGDSAVPVTVFGLTSGISAVSTGGFHTCALSTSDSVQCWGLNSSGQLGNSTTQSTLIPVSVLGLPGGISKIAAGGQHTCALIQDGSIWCWGENWSGQLGIGSRSYSNHPVQVSGSGTPPLVTAITALDTNPTSAASVRYSVTFSKPVSGVDSSDFSLTSSGLSGASVTGITGSGAAYTVWVSPGSGSGTLRLDLNDNDTILDSSGTPLGGAGIGNGSFTAGDVYTILSITPVVVTAISRADRSPTLAAYVRFTVTFSKAVTGVDLTDFSIGSTGLAGPYLLGVAGSGSTYTVTVSTGRDSGLLRLDLLDNDSILDSFARPLGGVGAGNGNFMGETYTIDRRYTRLAAGIWHACVVWDGAIKCWGWNGGGQLGNGTRVDATSPVNVSGLTSGYVAVTAGQDQSCALSLAGHVKCWGVNYFGQLGNGANADTSLPVDVYGLPAGISAISTGWAHTCALTTSGGVKCWGYNGHSQLGNGTTTNSNVPIDVTGLTGGVVAIAAGAGHTCALTEIGAVKCWGYNYDGELGNGTFNESSVPVDVSGLASGAVAVSAGRSHSCALLSSGTIKCWGNNQHGELGNGSLGSSNIPTVVNGLPSAITSSLSAGNDHTCGLNNTGYAMCWGDNEYGQLGIGLVSSSNPPAYVSGISEALSSISAGNQFTCALAANKVYCWGINQSGQLGDGTTTDRSTPGAVALPPGPGGPFEIFMPAITLP